MKSPAQRVADQPWTLDAVVVGSGPNGLAAALTMAAAGLRVQVIEGAPTIGGGCRTEELTLPGFRHDVCSAAHPLAVASPFFQRFDLAARGVTLASGPRWSSPTRWTAAGPRVVTRSVAETAAGLGADGRAYRRLLGPLTSHMDDVARGDPGPAAHAARASAGRRELRPPRHPAGVGGGQAVATPTRRARSWPAPRRTP